MALGNHGRLGNQMFQVAATLAVADKLKTEARFPGGSQVESVFELKDCNFNISENPKFGYFEKSFDFDPSIFSVPDSCNIHGYFQTEKYFKHCEELILKNFEFKESISNEADLKIKDVTDPICSVHVRRGDYLSLSDIHQFPGIDYYEKSMNRIREISKDIRFLVFSDDIEWCMNQEIFNNCQFVTEKTDYIELCLMTKCNFHIIANSSFSWWGSRLSKTSLTIAPARWFGHKGPKNWSDIYCEKWEII